DLPKTMRDAVTTCRRLSIRYLWIDALWIIQGQEGDFPHEAARMKAIYSGCIFTIAAADSKNPHGGCFRDRSPLCLSDCLVFQGEEHAIFIKSSVKRCGVMGNGGTPGECVLDKRAWVFQERMLSPRTLYFGHDNIHFECCEGLICAKAPECKEGRTCHAHRDFSLKFIFLTLITLDAHPLTDSLHTFQQMWRRILRYYSETALSHQEGRLSAIAGVVSALQDNLRL
ncbi:hypothetical protein K458DRAFT_294473, partial [Lentithecium fluviatile CBS 122367]